MEKEEYSTDYIKLKEMQDCIDNKNTMIEEKMIMWEELGEELRKYTKKNSNVKVILIKYSLIN